MSSSLNGTVFVLDEILENLYKYGGVILIILGTISSIINIIVFIQSDMRQIPATVYYIARNIFNFFFIYLSLLYVTLVLGYNIFPSSANLNYCHFSIYISLLCDILSPFYLILALADRLLVTLTNAKRKKQSTFQLASILTICSALFWIFFNIHALTYSEIVEIKSNSFHCDLKEGLYSTIIIYYSLIVKGILVPIILSIMGMKIMRNIRHTRRVQPVISIIPTKQESSTANEHIVAILIKDIFIYIIFSSIMSIVLIYELITLHHIKNFQQKQIEYFFRQLSTFCVSIPFCVGCYTNLIVSKFFRNEVKKIFSC